MAKYWRTMAVISFHHCRCCKIGTIINPMLHMRRQKLQGLSKLLRSHIPNGYEFEFKNRVFFLLSLLFQVLYVLCCVRS